MRRLDHDDVIFQTKREKYAALIDEIERINGQGLPILVGTTSVEVSEIVARMLKRRGLSHEVLNAKQHEREAHIVPERGAAGRDHDRHQHGGPRDGHKLADPCVQCAVCGIRSDTAAFGQLDEEPDLSRAEIKERGCEEEPPCGLQILGTERHESRRIDRQLRGRSGRQGDPGASLFFLSLEDDLMRLFMPERVAKIMDRLGVEEGEVITHPWITKSIERAQKRVEMQNFDARKRLLEYDDVMNQQREVVYDLRLYALEGGEDLKGETWEMIEEAIREEVDEYVPPGSAQDEWDLPGLKNRLLIEYFVHTEFLPREGFASADDWPDTDALSAAVVEAANGQFHEKLETFGELWEQVLRFIVLSVIDEKWKNHLYDLDHLRSSVGYRSYGQKDPLIGVQEGRVRAVRRPDHGHASECREQVLQGPDRGATARSPSRSADHGHEWSRGRRGDGSRRRPPGRRGTGAVARAGVQRGRGGYGGGGG